MVGLWVREGKRKEKKDADSHSRLTLFEFQAEKMERSNQFISSAVQLFVMLMGTRLAQ